MEVHQSLREKMAALAKNSPSSLSSPKLGGATPVRQRETQKVDDIQEGFILLDSSLLFDFFSKSVKCVACETSNLMCNLDLDSKMGFSHTLKIVWNTVLQISKNVESRQCGKPQKEVNIRMISFVRSIGRGHSALENFSMSLNSPAPMTKTITKRPSQIIMQHVKRSRLKVYKKLREDVVDCSFSLDGAW